MADQRPTVGLRAVMSGSSIDLAPLRDGQKEQQKRRDELKDGLMVPTR